MLLQIFLKKVYASPLKYSFAIFFVSQLLTPPILATEKINFNKGQIRIAGQILQVEIADDFKKRSYGLMNRDKLGATEGMLFVFQTPTQLNFWMKNTRIPLSIAFFDTNKRFLNSHEMEPEPNVPDLSLKRYVSSGQALYAVELPKGWFQKNKLEQNKSLLEILTP